MLKVAGALIGVLLVFMLSIGEPKPPPPILCIDAFPVSEPMCALPRVTPGSPYFPSVQPPILRVR